MSYSPSILSDLAVIMVVTAITVYVFHRLKQPLILGYLIGGIIIGPSTLPFNLISQPAIFAQAADIGVILLLFGIGLEFPISRFRKSGGVSLGIAIIEIIVMMALSFGFSRFLGWSLIQALFLGTALASSSTTIIAKVLSDLGKMKETSSMIMLGVLVIEDLIVVGLLALITSTISTGSLEAIDVLFIVLKILAFITGSLALGRWVVPQIVNRYLRLGNNEVLLLLILGLIFGLSLIANLLGLSLAIGAFLMGVAIAGSECVECVDTLIAPIRDMFAAIFFVSVGALIDFSQFSQYVIPALLITVLMIVGKIFGCGVGTRIVGYNSSIALKVGLGMSQIGEFAFIVMKAGQDLNVISSVQYSIVGVAVAITTFLTPYFIKISYKINLPDKKT